MEIVSKHLQCFRIEQFPDKCSYYFPWSWLQRITAAQIYKNDWFKKGYTPAKFDREADVSLDDVDAIFSGSTVRAKVALLHLVIFFLRNGVSQEFIFMLPLATFL